MSIVENIPINNCSSTTIDIKFLKTYNVIYRSKGSENSIVRDYVLPDYANIRKGYARTQEESTGRPTDSEQVDFLSCNLIFFQI